MVFPLVVGEAPTFLEDFFAFFCSKLLFSVQDKLELDLHLNPRKRPEEHTAEAFFGRIPQRVLERFYEKYRDVRRANKSKVPTWPLPYFSLAGFRNVWVLPR